MSDNPLTLSFLIPAYNDESTIRQAVEEAQKIGKHVGARFEILVINDASPDRTGVVLSRLTSEIPQLAVRTHKKNKGYGETIKELYYKGKYDWLFSVPGDYQIPARELVKLLPYKDDADMIIGLRVRRQDTLARRRQSKLYNSLLHVLFGLTIQDVNSVRLMRRSVVQRMNLTSRSAFVDAELVIRAKRLGFRVKEQPIEHLARSGTSEGGGGHWHIILPTIVEMLAFRLRSFFE